MPTNEPTGNEGERMDRTVNKNWCAESYYHRRPNTARPLEWVSIATLISSILAIGTLFATYFQYIETRKQSKQTEPANKIARDALVTSERPWLSVSASISSDFTNNQVPEIKINFDNLGKTPPIEATGNWGASMVSPLNAIRLLSMPISLPVIYPAKPKSFPLDTQTEAGIYALKFKDEILSSTREIYVVWDIKYKDIHNNNYETKGCLSYLHRLKEFFSCREMKEVFR